MNCGLGFLRSLPVADPKFDYVFLRKFLGQLVMDWQDMSLALV